MTVIAFDPYANPSLAAAASVELVTSMAELLEAADFLTIHTPLIASTKGMIGAAELSSMKKTARILNVARGGMIDENALLEALELGTIAGAGIDVFTSEPPKPESSAARLIAHPNVLATPHLGASTVEAQENVSIDVCTQVLSILAGNLPRSAVNAPIILPEEYRTLQPFVGLIEKMGSLYTQYCARTTSRTTFDIIYSGSLATLKTTQPLFAALVKGLLAPITNSETLNINIVNAELVARERGILINESRSRSHDEQEGYSSSITLRARLDPRSPSVGRRSNIDPFSTRAIATSRANKSGQEEDHTIAGFVSNYTPYISRLGRFSTSFVPQGTLLICRNYDEPGKIGIVGGRLGKAGVNIRFMSVAPIDQPTIVGSGDDVDDGLLQKVDSLVVDGGARADANGKEALMILGVEGDVGETVTRDLIGSDGVLEASVVVL